MSPQEATALCECGHSVLDHNGKRMTGMCRRDGCTCYKFKQGYEEPKPDAKGGSDAR